MTRARIVTGEQEVVGLEEGRLRAVGHRREVAVEARRDVGAVLLGLELGVDAHVLEGLEDELHLGPGPVGQGGADERGAAEGQDVTSGEIHGESFRVRSRSSLRRILPMGFLGSDARKRTCVGHLYFASRA